MTRLIVLLAGICAAAAQSPTFEAVAIRPGNPVLHGVGAVTTFRGCVGGPDTSDPGRLRCNIGMADLIRRAYQLTRFQFTPSDWMQDTWFEIDAKIPAGTTRDQFLIMQQNLLAERFKLSAHSVKKEMQIYEMTVANDGPKFKEWVDLPPMAPGEPLTRGLKAADLRPLPNSPARWTFLDGRHVERAEQSMPQLAEYLAAQLERPVLDLTGLKGEYDIMLEYVLEPPPLPQGIQAPERPPLAAGPTLQKAVESQLGLKLQSKKGSINVFVVDHIEKTPTEN